MVVLLSFFGDFFISFMRVAINKIEFELTRLASLELDIKSWIEKYENGCDFLSAERITKIREAIGISEGELKRLKKGRDIGSGINKKKVLTN